jgi:purine-cytosine permease-like protein
MIALFQLPENPYFSSHLASSTLALRVSARLDAIQNYSVCDEALLNNHGLPKTVGTDGDQFGHIEVRGIDYVPDAERHGTARELLYVCMAPNILYLDIILGGALIKLGLGIWPAIGAIVAGNAYWILIGLASISGARSGTPGAVVMRAMFGVRANRVNVAVSIWAIMVAYEGINLSVGALAGFALLQNLGVGLNGAWKLAIVVAISVATITVGVYGHATIVKLSSYFTVGLALCFAALAWFVLGHVNLHYIPPDTATGASFWAALTVGFVIIASNPLSWPPGADYTRYLPASTSGASIVIWTTVGAFIPAVLLSVLGALAGTAVDMTDPQTSFAAILPKWFYPIFLLVIILSSFTNNVITAYSSGLALQGVGLKVRRSVTVAIDGIVAVSLTIYALFVSNFFDALNNFLSLSVAVLGPCTAIYVTDSLLRRNKYDGIKLNDESPQSPFWYNHGVYWPGVVAEALGTLVALLCINSPVFVGPIARALKGSDLSAITGPVVAACVYIAMTRSARQLEDQGRQKVNPMAAGDLIETIGSAED